jgi:hypothetical protein
MDQIKFNSSERNKLAQQQEINQTERRGSDNDDRIISKITDLKKTLKEREANLQEAQEKLESAKKLNKWYKIERAQDAVNIYTNMLNDLKRRINELEDYLEMTPDQRREYGLKKSIEEMEAKLKEVQEKLKLAKESGGDRIIKRNQEEVDRYTLLLENLKQQN